VHAALAKDKATELTTKFSADDPKISVFWRGKGLQSSDTVSDRRKNRVAKALLSETVT